MKKTKKFKKGAASFYIVAFSTLILLIIAASFATVIISEITRTSNDDLAQSAYDSALAGVEDAKLAYYNYQNCLNNGGATASSQPTNLDCSAIMYYMENSSGGKNCDMVGHMLGRINPDKSGEVLIKETSSGNNNMAQAYTCVKIETNLPDYRATLSSSNPAKIVPVELDQASSASDIQSIKISWAADTEDKLSWTNFIGSDVSFPAMSAGLANPPTIAVTLVQTGNDGGVFGFSDFNKTIGDRTDRGTVYLVPTNNKSASRRTNRNTYIGAYNGTENYISKEGFLKSNDKTSKNKPYGVYCSENEGNEFICSATIELPKPVGGDRADGTFLFAVTLPYGGPSTDFAMEFCTEASGCTVVGSAWSGDEDEIVNRATITNQVRIDSTGRANDLYRRVETRIDTSNAAIAYPLYAIQLLGEENGNSADKDLEWVTSEHGICDGDAAYDGYGGQCP